MADLIGQRLGNYRILSLLGEGGMAAVYRARQLNIKRDVAIKVIKPELVASANQAALVKRFEREVDIVAALDHPNILKVFDFGAYRKSLYFVMPLLSGGNLSRRIRHGPLHIDQVVRLFGEIGDALDHAHGQGIIHRDLKPANILLDRSEHAVLSDFGIAKVLNETSALTRSGIALGTHPYMAPEQWTGQPLDARADLYALGVVLFEMLSGRVPFYADTPFAIMYLHLNEPPPQIRSLCPYLSEQTQQVIDIALSKDPAHRFQSATDMAAALRASMGAGSAQVTPWPGYYADSEYATRVTSSQLKVEEAPPTSPDPHMPTSFPESVPVPPRIEPEAVTSERVIRRATPHPGMQRYRDRKWLLLIPWIALTGLICGCISVAMIVLSLPVPPETEVIRSSEATSGLGALPTLRPGTTSNGFVTVVQQPSSISQPYLTPTPLLLVPPSITPVSSVSDIPELEISSPIDSSEVYVGEEVLVQVRAFDRTGITRIEMRVNNVIVDTATSPEEGGTPILEALLSWTPWEPGTSVVEVVAFRNSIRGNPRTITLTVQENASQVTYTEVTSQPGQSLAGTLPVIILPTLTPIPEILRVASANDQWTPAIQSFDGVEMVLVPAGCFMMGSNDGEDDERPVHQVCFDQPFWIDRTEVSNTQFAQFGGQAERPSNWSTADRPREQITWFEARDFCARRGARLPTEAEWEYAARGPSGLTYPWDNTVEGSRINSCDSNCEYDWKDSSVDDGYPNTAPVGSFPDGASWVGALDLSGNVWEWVNDWYGTYSAGAVSNPAGPATGKWRVLRGGSWSNLLDVMRASGRFGDGPVSGFLNVGFRCARP